MALTLSLTPLVADLLAHVRTGEPEDAHIWIVVQRTEGIQGRGRHRTSGVVQITMGVTLRDHVVEIRDRSDASATFSRIMQISRIIAGFQSLGRGSELIHN